MTTTLAAPRWRMPYARSGGLVLTTSEIQRVIATLRDVNTALRRDAAAWRLLRADLAAMRRRRGWR